MISGDLILIPLTHIPGRLYILYKIHHPSLSRLLFPPNPPRSLNSQLLTPLSRLGLGLGLGLGRNPINPTP